MIALTPVNLEKSALTAFGYDPTQQVLAITFKNDADTYHFQAVPQDVVDGLSHCVASCENPPEQLFASAEPETPDHYLTRFVKSYYDFTKITGAAAADDVAMADPTIGN